MDGEAAVGEWFTTFFDSLVNDFWGAAMPESREMSVWVLTSGELVRLVTGAGFEVEALHGDLDARPFELGSSRLLVVARRPLRSGHAGRPLRSGHAGRP